jgi:FkbM family methyltransferase
MLLKFEDLQKKINFDISGVIHIGAGSGAELKTYIEHNIQNIIMIEADKKSFFKLSIRKIMYDPMFRKNISLINQIISDKNEIMNFNLTNVSDCNSILRLKKHQDYYPHIKKIKQTKIQSQTLNKLFKYKYDIKKYNFINIDIQGAELLALKKASEILPFIDGIYTEINFEELYENCAMSDELDSYLMKFNFKRVYTNTDLHKSWGDALYIKSK